MARGLAICCMLMLSACRAKGPSGDAGEPFAVALGECTSWTEGRSGYDPDLPGYHITGGIASISLRPTGYPSPDHLVLAIATSPGGRPMLESFNVSTEGTVIHSALFNGLDYDLAMDKQGREVGRSKRGELFSYEVVGKEVHVTFKPKAMKLLAGPCTVGWIDRFRR